MIASALNLLIGSLFLAKSQAATLTVQPFNPAATIQVLTNPAAGSIPETDGSGSTVVVFTEKSGFGCYTTADIEVFAQQSLNLVLNAGRTAEIKTFHTEVASGTYQPGPVPVPEIEASLIGGLGLLLLLRRRR